MAQDARLGDQDGIDGQAQLGGDVFGGNPIDDVPAESLPGGRLEVGLDQAQQALQDEPVVLPVPSTAQFAGRVLQLIERRIEVRRTGCESSNAS